MNDHSVTFLTYKEVKLQHTRNNKEYDRVKSGYYQGKIDCLYGI